MTLDTEVNAVVQNVIDENKVLFQGIGELKNFQLKLYIGDSVTPIQQPGSTLPYHATAKVAS